MNKKIVWCGNSYFGSSLKVGCQYYSEILAEQNNKVLFISTPISPYHNRKYYKKKFEQAKNGITKITDYYYVYTPYTLIPPIKILPKIFNVIIKKWHKFTIPNLCKTLKKYDFIEADILVIDYFAFLPLLDIIKYKQLIVRVTDKLCGFVVGKAAIKAEEMLIKKADKVIYTSRELEDYVKKFSNNAYYLSNGVEFKKYQGDFQKPDIFTKINKPVAIYIGTVDYWFDYDILDYVTDELPNMHFLIIGPIKHKPNVYYKIEKKNNVNFLGYLDNNLMPKYLKYSTVGIIPFRLDLELVHGISPLKLYEYMACGLPVVATKWKELENIKSPAFLSENKFEFKDCLISACNTIDKDEIIKFAKANDWEEKVKYII